MFLRLEISWVFAGSPRYRFLELNPTSELWSVSTFAHRYEGGVWVGWAQVCTYGVARLETSLAIWDSQVSDGGAGQRMPTKGRQGSSGLRCTHNINTPVSRNSDHGVEGTEIDTDDTHICFVVFVAGREWEVWMGKFERDFCERKRRRDMGGCGGFFQSSM